MTRSRLRWTLAASVLCVAPLAHAQASQDKAAASQLFDDAEKLMSSGHAAEACPKYEESNRLDPQLGTLLHLGECFSGAGKTASAWATFKDAAEIAAQRSDPREGKIRQRIQVLEGKLPKIAISVGAGAPAGLEVQRDGGVVGNAMWGSALPVDPGDHVVSASAPGRVTWSTHVQASAGATASVSVPLLEPTQAPPAPVAAAPTPAPAPPAPVGPASSPPILVSAEPPPPVAESSDTSAASPGSGQRALGWVATGVGVAGLAVGTVFLLQRSSKLSDRDDICPTSVNCPVGTQARIDSLTSDARTATTIGTIGLIAGGVLTVSGVVLVLSAPHGERQGSVALVPALAPTFQGVMLSGRL